MMNKMMLKSLCMSALCIAGLGTVQAAETSKAEQQKYLQVCKGKSQGNMVSFAHKGVIYNGTCETGHDGKLSFQPPTPAAGLNPETQSQISETQSEPRPVSTPPSTPNTPSPHRPHLIDPMPIPSAPPLAPNATDTDQAMP